MNIELDDKERKLIGFHLACRLEDMEKDLKRLAKTKINTAGLQQQIDQLEELTYTKIIPDSWCGPRPTHWRK